MTISQLYSIVGSNLPSRHFDKVKVCRRSAHFTECQLANSELNLVNNFIKKINYSD